MLSGTARRALTSTAAVTAFTLLAWIPDATAQCAVGTKITIDYDIAGSGYTEESSNWTTWTTSPCYGPGYRYLSHTVGDGSRKGKAIWKPNIAVAGHYSVVSGYRSTENRTNDADYFSYDDHGMVIHEVVDQSTGDACEWVDLGTSWCNPGGACRVELDGTDDNKSDCADVTIYELVDCDEGAGGSGGGTGGTGGSGGSGGTGGSGGGTGGTCDGIRANPAWEVCEETSTTCKGVFTDGAGCVAYCAAAGMTCTARFGGEPGCSKEPLSVLACGDDNGHLSDWCECEGPPPQQDAGSGGSAGTGGTAGSGGVAGQAGAGGAAGSGGVAGQAGAAGSAGTSGVAGWPSTGGTSADASTAGTGGSTGTGGASGTGPTKDAASTSEDGGCSCSAGSKPASLAWLVAALGIALGTTVRRKQGGW